MTSATKHPRMRGVAGRAPVSLSGDVNARLAVVCEEMRKKKGKGSRMKNSLLLAACALALGSTPAFAAHETAPVRTHVPVACAVQDPATFSIDVTLNHDINNIGPGGYGTITSFTPVAGQNINIACNSEGSTLTISAAAMHNGAGISPDAQANGYTDTLDFQASFRGDREFDHGANNAWWSVRTDGSPTSNGRPDSYAFGVYAATNVLSIEDLDTINNGRRPIAGNFHGTVTLTLTP